MLEKIEWRQASTWRGVIRLIEAIALLFLLFAGKGEHVADIEGMVNTALAIIGGSEAAKGAIGVVRSD